MDNGQEFAAECEAGYRQHRYLLGDGCCAVSKVVQPSGTGQASAAVWSQPVGRLHRRVQGVGRYVVSELVQPAQAFAMALPP